ncbi:MAG: hypothetical protein ACKOFG_15435, partial [Limnohabitans sp.]
MDAKPNTPMKIDLKHLQSWIGRTESVQDLASVAPLRALSATLDRDEPAIDNGTEVPHCWHWLYFLPMHRQSELGPDGHARRGGFLPPRRAWPSGPRSDCRCLGRPYSQGQPCGTAVPWSLAGSS